MTITRRRWPVRAATALFLVSALTGTACNDSQEGPSVLTGTVKVGSKYDQPGFHVHHDHEDAGFDTDLARYLGQELGFQPAFLDVPSARREQSLENGHSDLVIATYSITPERQKRVDFAGPYLKTYQGLLVRAGDRRIRKRADVADKILCTAAGSTSTRKFLPPGTTLYERSDYSTCVKELLDENVDAVFTDTAVLHGFTQQYGNNRLRVLPDVTFGTPNYYGVGLPKGHQSDCQRIAAALKRYLQGSAWATSFRAHLPAIVAAHPGTWENKYKPDPGAMDEYSCRSD
ncbi:transporter substrate-binding domain-containing protein [Streptomyces sp. NPDC005407]|uniref:transporter substrate-binding domain-containing protein n=1 Tax=Streptomyces sp. NPDC005407 TaxID=3155340 RepID=UPI0033BC8E05